MTKIGTNIASLLAQRSLGKHTEALGRVYERLSSGMRINRASDDAAGLAISDSLRANARVYNQGIRNLNDGVSLLNIADGALEQLSIITLRLSELAEQAANGAYSNEQRKALDAEAQALSKEFFRISRVTKFNGLTLFDGSMRELRLQAGYGIDGSIAGGLGGYLGTGTFGALASYAVESLRSLAIATGDLNGDGLLDVVTAGETDSGDGYATVRLGLGSGTFGSATSYSTETGTTEDVVLGDVNGDGILDLLTAGNTDGNDGFATVRLGLGNGTFGSASSYSTESYNSQGIALGDLNNDGFLDLVTAGRADSNDGYATIRLGRGDGTFGSATSYDTETFYSRGATLGDLNSDGILDLVTTGLTDGTVGYATIHLGRGDGTFGAAYSYAQETNYSDNAVILDLNGDGINDLVTAGQASTSEGYITVRIGQGNGTFGEATSYAQGGIYARGLTYGDVNGDGIWDILSAGRTAAYDGFVTVRLGRGDGTFNSSTSYLQESKSSQEVALGDFNGDGVPDLVTAGDSDGNDGFLTIRLSDVIDGVHPLLPFSLKTLADARQAIPIIKRKQELLAEQRGEIGAFQSRISVASNVLQSATENFLAAESRIRDADIAEEASDLIRLNILQQAASAILAQANQQPSLVLKLLTQ